MSATLPPNPIAADAAAPLNADDSKPSAAQGQASEDPEQRHRAEAFSELLSGELQALNGVAPAPDAETAGDGRQVVAADGKALPSDLAADPAGDGAFYPFAALPGQTGLAPDPNIAAEQQASPFAGLPNPAAGAPAGDAKAVPGELSDQVVRRSGLAANNASGAITVATSAGADGDPASPSFDDVGRVPGAAHKLAGVGAGGAEALSATRPGASSEALILPPTGGAATPVHGAGGLPGASSASSPGQPSATSLAIPVPVDSPRWPEQVGQRVRWLINGPIHSAELRLEPPQLGLIQVRIEFHDHQAQVHFDAQHADARAAIDAALPKLREMFAHSGIALGSMDVGGQGAGGAGSDSGGGPFSGGQGAAAMVSEGSEAPADAPRLLGEGMLDHYA